MHLLIPFASATSEPAQFVLNDLALPHLTQLLKRLVPGQRVTGDEYSLNPPHERALANIWGWRGADGCLPFAAQAAASEGLVVGEHAWGLMTPAHWLVGRDHITLTDPASLALNEAESRAIFEAVRELFESEGLALHWAAPTRWYLQHDSLQALPCASLDRVLGRNVDLWLQAPQDAPAEVLAALRRLRRLQNEFQMLLYPHAITQERDARGLPAVNSFWLSGCGRWQPQAAHAAVQINDSLRASALSGDWAAWREAWLHLDATLLAALNRSAAQGDQVALTLCGERHAQTWQQPQQRSLLDRLKNSFTTPNTAAWLQAL